MAGHQLACGLKKAPKVGLLSLSDFKPDCGSGSTLLGKGAFGEVFLVTHTPTGRKYALKQVSFPQIRKSQVELEGQMTILKREILVHESLDHPNVVHLFEHFENEEWIYLVLEWAEKGNLFWEIHGKKRMMQEEVRRVFWETCQGVRYLHERDIIHRDLKPENLLLTADNHIKICDFGWCVRSTETRGTFCGTLDYMAPEIIIGSGHTSAVDIWALGVLLYELSHGKSPFSGTRDEEKCNKIVTNSYKVDMRLSSTLLDLIRLLLKQRPEERPNIVGVLSHPYLATCQKKDSINTEFQRISSESAVSSTEEKVTVTLTTKIMSRREVKMGPGAMLEDREGAGLAREKEEELLEQVEQWCAAPRMKSLKAPGFMEELENTSKKLENSLASLSSRHDPHPISSGSKQLLLQGQAKLVIHEEPLDGSEELDLAGKGVLLDDTDAARKLEEAAAAELDALGEEYLQLPRQSVECDMSITPLEEELLNEDFCPCPFNVAHDSLITDPKPLAPQPIVQIEQPSAEKDFEKERDRIEEDNRQFHERMERNWAEALEAGSELDEMEERRSVKSPAKRGPGLMEEIERLHRETRYPPPEDLLPPEHMNPSELEQRRKHIEELLSNPNFKLALAKREKQKRQKQQQESGFLRWIGSFLGCTEKE